MKEPSSKISSLKKHVAAIHCSGELSLVERKLSNILLLNAYNDLLTKDVHTIQSRLVFAMLGWEDSNNIDGLKTTLKSLMSTIVEFNLIGDGKDEWEAMTLLSSAKLVGGECSYSYSKGLAAKFYKPEVYAVINLAVQKRFKSNYALTLYENCIRFINVGSTGYWEIATFRKMMGAKSPTYDEFKRLSSFVIKVAVNEINAEAGIKIVADYKKVNRKVVAVRFTFLPKTEQTLIESNIEEIKSDNIYLELKETELFKRLRSHGIGERLVLSWMIEEPYLAAKAVDYTESMDSKGLIRGKTAGYIRRLIETRAQFGESEYESKKNEKIAEKTLESTQNKQREYMKKRVSEYQRFLYQQALKNISQEQLQQFKDEFLLSEQGKNISETDFNSENGKFVNKITQLSFLPWLKNTITPKYSNDDFEVWLKDKV